MVTQKGFPKELETVARDLWSLRLNFLDKSREERSGYSSGTGTMMFSSQSEGDGTDNDGSGFRSVSSRRSRKSRSGEEQRLPKLAESMALCYLGAILMRLPISLGEVTKWIIRDEIPYSRAVSHQTLEF